MLARDGRFGRNRVFDYWHCLMGCLKKICAASVFGEESQPHGGPSLFSDTVQAFTRMIARMIERKPVRAADDEDESPPLGI